MAWFDNLPPELLQQLKGLSLGQSVEYAGQTYGPYGAQSTTDEGTTSSITGYLAGTGGDRREYGLQGQGWVPWNSGGSIWDMQDLGAAVAFLGSFALGGAAGGELAAGAEGAAGAAGAAGGAVGAEGAAGAALGESGGMLALDVGGGEGLGAAAYTPWEEGFAGTGALTDSATAELGGAAEASLGAEVDPMAYGGGGESATWGATEGGMPTSYDAVNGMDLNSDIATNTGIVPEGSINAGLTTTGGLPSGGPTLDGTGGLPGGGGSPTGTPPGAGGLGLPSGIPWSTLLQGLGGIGSGLSGMQAGKDVASAMDPFGKYRNDYADKLNALWNDPSTITKMPGYQAGLTAVERSLGAQGYTGSGNMMAALSEYGGGQFDKTLQELMTLSGANTQPGAGAVAGANLNSAGQGSVGYGLSQLLKLLGGGGSSGSGTDVTQYGGGFDPSLFNPANIPGNVGPTTPDGFIM